MAGNFIKGGFVKLEDDNKVIIDNNEAIKKRLEELKNIMPNFQGAFDEDESQDSNYLNDDELSKLVSEDSAGDVADLLSDDGFSAGIDALEVNDVNVIESVSDKSQEEYENIIAAANEEAEAIRNRAQEEGYNEGYSKGLSEGKESGRSELEQEYNRKSNLLDSQLAEKERALNEQYESMINDLEPMLVDKIMDVIMHVTGIELSGNRETIMTILKSALENMDNGKHYLIHVSPEDYDNVKNNISDICKGTGLQEDSFDIIEDNSVAPNGALIESEAGIFDCGLGSQLELLKKKLMLISFE